MDSSVSSLKPVEEEHNLDKLVAELHALKKLYGLLQKNSAGQALPDQPASHLLDEKSSDLLKKLLDDATQQVFDCQAKIISCASEISKSQQKSNTNPPPEKSPEPVITGPQTEQKILINSCPIIPEPSLKQASFHRPSQSKNMTKPSQPLRSASNRLKSIRSDSSGRRLNSKKGDEFLALVPAQKRQRVEPVQLSSRVSSGSTKPHRNSCKLSHHKKNVKTNSIREQDPIKSLQPTSSSVNRASKVTPLADRTAEIVHRNDRLVDKDLNKLARLNRLKAKRYVSSSDSSWSNSGSHSPTVSISGSNSSSSSISWAPKKQSGYSTRRRKPSQITSMVRIVPKNDQMAEKKTRAIKQIKPSPSKHGSSRSNGHSIPSKQSRVKTERRKAPPPPPPQLPAPPRKHHLSLVSRPSAPPRRPTKSRVEKKEKEEQGKFRRLTNKLAVIFHHHHHHHHLHAGEDGGVGRQEGSSLWKHFKTALHLGSGNGEEETAAKERRRHGYLRVMIEGLLQQLWGMRWRRKKMARRRASKKQRCWAWFRRRGGVVVGGRRRVRLRLGHSDSRRRIDSGRQ